MNTTGKHNRLRPFFMAAAIVLVLVCVLPVCFIVSQTMQKKVPESINKAGSSLEPSVSPTKNPASLEAVQGVKLVRYSTHSVKVAWKKHKNAKFYSIYYYKEGRNAHLAAITKSTQYIIRGLKNNTTYYFYIVAGKKRKISGIDSQPSQEINIKTRTYVHKTIFAGDSICQTIGYGQAIPQMKFKGKKEVIACYIPYKKDI